MKKKYIALILGTYLSYGLTGNIISNAQEIITDKSNIQKENTMIINEKIPQNMTKITKHPLTKEKVLVNTSIKNLNIADKNATEKTKKLLSYLKNVTKQNKFIFGQQNDVINSVKPNMLISSASEELKNSHNSTEEIQSVHDNLDSYFAHSNSKDLTGSITGMFGIDGLSLTGDETHLSNPEEALKKSINVSLKAAKEGALITLSCHMPNFSSENIQKLPNGKYDFTKCTYMDSCDFSGSIQDIMPNGKYHSEFTAYLDIIADYALALQKQDIPVLFRPFHENSGSWFWWGGEHLTPQESIDLFRYTADYLKNKGVHNFIYVYSPNGPVTNEQEYMLRYPGDDYVDILAFDQYIFYQKDNSSYNKEVFHSFQKSYENLNKIAKKHNKVAGIAETGAGITYPETNSNAGGLLMSDNKIFGKNWFKQVGQVAIDNDIAYCLIWANFNPYNCYIPYKYNNEYGHELCNDFIDFYNWDKVIFANNTNFY